MGPPSGSEHVRSEELSVKGKPCKDLAFGLRVGKPDLEGVKLSKTYASGWYKTSAALIMTTKIN
jgi:hypothetical protein